MGCNVKNYRPLIIRQNFRELNRASILRDVFNDTLLVSKLMMKSCTTKQRIIWNCTFKQSIVKFYQSNDTPIFEKYNIERQIKTSFGKTVSMSKGAYLIIEHTEALHVIDVNSGNRSNKASTKKILPWRSTWLPLPKSLDNCVYVIWY
jgi:ribonuclease G